MSTKKFHFGDWLSPHTYELDYRSYAEVEKSEDWKNMGVKKKKWRPQDQLHLKDSQDVSSRKSYKKIGNLTK